VELWSIEEVGRGGGTAVAVSGWWAGTEGRGTGGRGGGCELMEEEEERSRLPSWSWKEEAGRRKKREGVTHSPYRAMGHTIGGSQSTVTTCDAMLFGTPRFCAGHPPMHTGHCLILRIESIF
jgi:hypothetical protein